MLIHRIAFAGMLMGVTACATATTPEALEAREKDRAEQVFANDPRRGEEVRKVCFANNIDGFRETTKRAVVVREGRDEFLIETFAGCQELDWANSIAIDSFSSCLTKGDRIFAFESAFGTNHTSTRSLGCRVKTIYAWDRDAEATKDDGDAPEGEETTEDAIETQTAR